MESCIDMKISMGDLRKEFEKIYPTAHSLHMNVIAEVMVKTDFFQVNKTYPGYDFYRVKHIKNRCKAILDKAKEN